MAAAFESLARRGLLDLPDPQRAAEQFAFLVLGAALDRAMFEGRDETPDADAVALAADDGVRTFLAAFGPVRREGGD
jgi:hypothetical protein